MYKVLFVCTGNICRSPTAEAVFRKVVDEAGLSDQIMCDSVGTHNYHVGENPDPRTIAAAKSRGVQMGHLIGRKLSPHDYSEFDLLLAMDGGHLRIMQRQEPAGSTATLAMFLGHAGITHTDDVPDPYYGGAQGFEHVLDLVEEASEKLLARIQAEAL